MKKTCFIMVLILLFVIPAFCSCKSLDNKKIQSEPIIAEAKHVYNSTKDGNNIYIEYPSFNIESVDKKFKLFAENALTFDKNEYKMEDTTFTAEYEITLLSEEYISVKYNASIYHSKAAYPSSLLTGVTIRVADGYVMKAKDFISWNQTNTVDLLVNAAKAQISPEILAGVFPDQALTKEDRESIFTNLSSANYCLDKENIIIFYTVPHAAGDYISISLNKKELADAVLQEWK